MLLTMLLTAFSAAAIDTVPIVEWKVPWANTRPRDPYVAPDGRIWFVGQAGDYVGVLDAQSGDFRRYELEPGTGPHNLIVDRAGIVWYAGNRTGHIGRLDPATGAIRKYPMPDTAAWDPHTLVFDHRGRIWFTVQNGNHVGRFNPESGEVKLLKVPVGDARPYGIVVDPSGRPWINLFGAPYLATVDPERLTLDTIPLPHADARGRRLALTSDGRVWYVDYARNTLGVYDPRSRAVKEYPAPSGARSRPYAMTVDDKDRLWFVETGVSPNRLVAFDSRSGRFVSETPVPSGGGTVRHMVFHGPTKSIWFGTDAGTIGRAAIR